MKAFNSSALSNNRAEVIKSARDGGAVIQIKETNGEVREEFVLMPCIVTEADGYRMVHTKEAIHASYIGEVYKPLEFKRSEDE